MEEAVSTTVQSFVDQIAAKAKVDQSADDLVFIQREGNATKVAELFDQLPCAADLARKHEA
jgi:hypothetical protein